MPGNNGRSGDFSREIMLLIVCGATARLIFAAGTGLGIDETYMVAVGRHWELGYFDHPPLAWWIARSASWLAGTETGWIVRAPFIALFAISTWLMYRLGTVLFGATSGFIAAVAVNCAPVLGVTTASWVLPDGPLDAALLAGALCLANVLFAPSSRSCLWLLAGVFGGLAMLSKLHGVFLFAGAGLFLLTSAPHRRWLATAWPYGGALIALAILSPAIVWNAHHDWASLAFQGARAATRTFRPWMPLVALAGQAAFLAPWIWAPLVYVAAHDARKLTADPRAWLLICLGIGPIAFFTLVSAWSDQKPYFHWAAPGYLMLFPLLGRAMSPKFEAGSRGVSLWLKSSIAFDLVAALGIVVLCVAPMVATPIRWIAPGMSDPMAEMSDWTDVPTYLRDWGLFEDPHIFVVGRRWYEAAKIDYALHAARDVVCIGDDCRGYDFVQYPIDHAGDDAIVMVPENSKTAALERIAPRFASVETMPTLTVMHGPWTLVRLSVFRARSYKPVGR
jgi:hypothetical protein